MGTNPPHTVLYDGDCAFCNGWVKWIRKRDLDKVFSFVSLTSEEGLALRRKVQVPEKIDSVVVIVEGRAHWRAAAARHILHYLPRWKWAAFLIAITPRSLADRAYDLIARNRHRLGAKDECELPA